MLHELIANKLNIIKYHIGAAWLFMCVLSCTTARKSAGYYYSNQDVINEIRAYYDSLYAQKPLTIGFTDKSFKYYVMEVATDTVRYVYNTEKSERRLYETITKFDYDTSLLRKLSIKMKEIKCLWLDKSSFYIDEKKETVTFLSFKSVAIDKPFVENKYYILLFLPHPIKHTEVKARAKKGQIVRINDLVYFAIGNRFR